MTHEHGTIKCRIISDCKRGLEAIMIDLAVLDKTEDLKDTLCNVYAELDAMHQEKETIYFR